MRRQEPGSKGGAMPEYRITYRLTGRDGLPDIDVRRAEIEAPGRGEAIEALRRLVSTEGGLGIRVDRIDVAHAPEPPRERQGWQKRVMFILIATLSLVQVATMLFSDGGRFP
jgi:hypothetical protein